MPIDFLFKKSQSLFLASKQPIKAQLSFLYFTWGIYHKRKSGKLSQDSNST